jgi:two-component system, sensor histidine kinase LadS
MNKRVITIIVCFIAFFKAINAKTEDLNSFVLEEGNLKTSVYEKLYWFEDAKDSIDFSIILDSSTQSKFRLNATNTPPNLGFTHSSYWFKLSLQNKQEAQKFLLEIPYPFLNLLEFYIPNNQGNYQRILLGDHFPFSKRLIRHKNYLVEINFLKGEQKTIYAHIKCDGEATSFPVTIFKPIDLVKRDYTEQFTLGAYYGILIFALFLSIFLGASLKERLNFYYLFYILGIGIFQLSLDGLAFQYLRPNSTWMANHIIPLSGAFAILFLLLFSRELLDTKKQAPQLNKILWLVMGLNTVLMLASLFNNPFYSLSLKSLNFVALIANLLVLITAVHVYKKKYPPARYFLIAFSLLILGILAALLKNFGFLPRVFITEYGIQIGSAIEIIFISFALAERVKTLKMEKEMVQELLVDQLMENNKSQKEINIELEKKVKLRTQEIVEKNILIEEKNRDITDSINYAKRIQQAILPRDAGEEEILENMFIYFRPRDIVSGDFYWFTKRNNKLIIAAADCTGHGVPGAFMSMIGSTLLNKVINDMGETNPSEILQLMDANIVDALKQKDELSGNRDGMDMALVAIEKDKNELVFSSASRPLYLVRKGELIEFKSSANSIGGYMYGKEKTFENTRINYELNDMIYLFSDGYVDQFGGANNKKFMSKKLKQMLAEIADLSLVEQKQVIHKTLNEWMGNNKQIDDILIIGIRF